MIGKATRIYGNQSDSEGTHTLAYLILSVVLLPQ